jgi:N-acetylmuramoyl-L-alanine amidase
MGHRASRLLHVFASATVAATLAAISAPLPAALAATPGPPAPYVVTLDPGHGGSADNNHPELLFDPGVEAVNGLVEKDLTLDIAKRVRDRLRRLGVQVVMTRDRDQYVDITPRIEAANSHNANLFVSIHLNYFGDDPDVGGSLVLYPNAASEAFATAMAATLGKQLGPIGIPSDGAQLRDNLWTTAQMPAVTVECAYLSNLGEATMLRKSSALDAIATAIVKGMQAQDPELTRRSAEIAAYARAHHLQTVPVSLIASPGHNLLTPWAVLVVAGALMVAFRRRLIPVMALMLALVGLALGRFKPDEPEWRTRSGVRRRRSRAKLWGTS